MRDNHIDDPRARAGLRRGEQAPTGARPTGGRPIAYCGVTVLDTDGDAAGRHRTHDDTASFPRAR
jgi:hypothetical protein